MVKAIRDGADTSSCKLIHLVLHVDVNINVSGIANSFTHEISANYNIYLQECKLRFRSEKINIVYEKNSNSIHEQFISQVDL